MAIRTLIKICDTAGFWPKVATVPNLPSVILQIDAGYGAAIISAGNLSFGNPNLKYLHLPEFDSIPMSEYAIVWLNENEKITNRALIHYLHENVFVNGGAAGQSRD
jgi:hypothetical protein